MTKQDTYRLFKPWYWFIQAITLTAFRLGCGVTVRGKEKIPKQGPVIFAPVHLSNFDPPLLGCIIPRFVRFMAKEELFKGFLGWLIHSVGAFPVSRGAGDSSALRIAKKTLEDKGFLIMFPEGSRGNGKELGHIEQGFAMLAERADALVMPVGISGTEKALGLGQKKPKRAHLTIVFGDPISLKQLNLQGKEGRVQFAEILAQKMVETTKEAGLELRVPALASSKG